MKKRLINVCIAISIMLSVFGCANRNTYSPYPNNPQYQAYPYGYGQPGAPIQPSPTFGAPVQPGFPTAGAPNVPGSVPTYPVQPGAMPMQPGAMPMQPGAMPMGQVPGQPGTVPNIPAGYQYNAPPGYPTQPYPTNPTANRPWIGW